MKLWKGSPCDMTDHNPILPEDARIVRIKDTEYVAIHKYWWDKEKKAGPTKKAIYWQAC